MPLDLCAPVPKPAPPAGASQQCRDEYDARWAIDDAAFAYLCGQCNDPNKTPAEVTACKRDKRDRRIEWAIDAIQRMGVCIGDAQTWVDAAIAAVLAES